MADAEIVLISDPRVAAVPVLDNGEPLVDVRTDGRLLVDPGAHDVDGGFAEVRAGVLDRLLLAQQRCPDGLRLLLIEGYRPVEAQRRHFDAYVGRLRAAHPGWPAGRLRLEASKYVSPPEVAPHTAGAAVDLTLARADGAELDMGSPLNASPLDSAGACYTAAPGIPARARANRDLLVAILTAGGFVNYPTEWWHWSYGDRYWALRTASPAACYGAINRR